ncbi:MAG: hypothetical protein ACNA7M_10150, partial [Roseovarius sp.]
SEPPTESSLGNKIIIPPFDATPDFASAKGRATLCVSERSKPGFALTMVLLGVVVAILVFAASFFWIASFWWAIFVAYVVQVGFILIMLGGYYMSRPARKPRISYKTNSWEEANDQIIDAAAPVWVSYQPKAESLNQIRRVAMSAASDRNSRKCCEWLAEFNFEVHLCSDHDTLIGDLIARPERWSLLIVDVDHIGESAVVPREMEYIRSGLTQVPVILMTSRSKKAILDLLGNEEHNLVLAKPFFRKCLFEAVEILNPAPAQDGH